jgi:hypothetical protein
MDLIILEWFLRLFGLFWMAGGILAFRMARLLNTIDNAVEALTQVKEDKLTNRFLFIGSILTFLSGLGLFILTRWALIPITLLVGSQLIYFQLKQQRMEVAKTEEEKEEARVNPSTIRAFWVSVGVAIASAMAYSVGLLK